MVEHDVALREDPALRDPGLREDPALRARHEAALSLLMRRGEVDGALLLSYVVWPTDWLSRVSDDRIERERRITAYDRA